MVPTKPTTSASISDDISDKVLSRAEAELLLAEYRLQFADSFPYVVLSDRTTLSDLRQDGPMLLLAILATTSWKDRTLQEVLNQVFLKKLSSELIVRGKRDLDLLQGLLVYLNWFHLHVTPQTQQAYRLMAIASTVAIDFGITRRPGKGRHREMNVETVNEAPEGLVALDADYWSHEAKRACLGCYHLATWYSIMTRKESPLAYNEYMHACASSLAATNEVPSDADLVFHLELTREADRVSTLFNYSETLQPQRMSDEQMQIYLNTFSSKIRDWQAHIPTTMTEDPCQQLWPWIFEAFTREIGPSGMSRDSRLSLPRIRILVDSLVSTKTYLDVFLSIPDERLPSLSATQWVLLLYSFLLATTASLSIDTSEWNIQTARSIIRLEEYLEALSGRVKVLSSQMSPVKSLFDWYGSLMARWDAMKYRYLAALEQAQDHTQTQTTSASILTDSMTTQSIMDLTAQVAAPDPPQSWWDGSQAQSQMGDDDAFMPVAGFDLLNFASNAGSWMMTMSDSPYY
ncbi:hypothetical protein LTR99_008098 [Exophiala xenobiotica]|uniref:Transcription factor domain-containing protein n=1 Tax=Vermiconidia calcicola TaxID=1690605 RepID=A0AAV9QL66_9PEZI|nr:hypothetical protein LTR96_008495 [Exophiala xenobiotica]KAK5543418.1 hypothetical protein LTR25_001031 [Vermiconidia calcicola]KAK5544285.1 hypothetical protein LTR23_004664 [Chaetothyriales sp. CCFEE 6169]KAK5297696.1 hypothetical protein LTR99_008098 [Exophiala xenobiotica]KAK5335352.1 hypothetical protein LTR98_008351 [Exophiala xenobiotica]